MKLYFESKRKLHEDLSSLKDEYNSALSIYVKRKESELQSLLDSIADKYSECVEEITSDLDDNSFIHVMFSYPNPDKKNDVISDIMKNIFRFALVIDDSEDGEAEFTFNLTWNGSPSVMRRILDNQISSLYRKEIDRINKL